MKIIAFYLPQFHTIPENDLWWGEGFTEWTNTKKAKPLYRGHYQPREPLNDDYYNLMNNTVMTKQMKLAKEYGIDAFCFYHYWFNGKKLLEKPVERLLNNPEAELPFCLSWANEPWTRAWYGREGEKEVLQVQEYGEEQDWTEHFMYLLPFFQDKRYLCIDNKPVFLIYRSHNILKCDQMLEHWNKLAIEHGLPGLYLVTMETIYEVDQKHHGFDASVEFEPMRTIRELSSERAIKREKNLEKRMSFDEKSSRIKRCLDRIPYDECYSIITSREHKGSRKTFLGAFVDWDNTPRKGNKGLIITGGKPKKFERYLKIQIDRSKQLGNELLFINAWNEWSESTYLEPDKRYGYAYLAAVHNAVSEKEISKDNISKSTAKLNKKKAKYTDNSREDKFRKYYQLTNQWLLIKNKKKSLAEYLTSKGYHHIAIYGMGELGNRLYEELLESSVIVDYAIDRYPENNYTSLKFFEISKELMKVDAIIVTPIFDFSAIETKLKECVDYPIISLEEVVYGL